MLVHMALKYDAIVATGLKLKAEKFWALIATFVEIASSNK